MPKTKRAVAMSGDHPSIPTPRGQADRLFRAAAECVRQRQRYARLVEGGTPEEEQVAALRIACVCDELLLESVRAYETIANGTAHRDEEWGRRANALWLASRDYERRHGECDERSRRFGSHSPSKLAELAMEYDLEASALLALKQAVAAYRKAVPEADLETARVA
jgi:hypothetical protein